MPNVGITRIREIQTDLLPKIEKRRAELSAERDKLVLERHEHGRTYAEIAEELDVSTAYIQVMVQRARGDLPPSRRSKGYGRKGRPPKEAVNGSHPD